MQEEVDTGTSYNSHHVFKKIMIHIYQARTLYKYMFYIYLDIATSNKVLGKIFHRN